MPPSSITGRLSAPASRLRGPAKASPRGARAMATLRRGVLAAASLRRRLLHSAAPQAAPPPSPPPLPLWAGGDVPALVHRALDDMSPTSALSLPGRVFNAPVRQDLVHRTVHWQLAKRRAGTASTKTRAEVAGSGRKIRPQKGSGRSRQGAATSPLFRGGGRAHGPKPRDWGYPLPAGVRRAALRAALSSKLWAGQLWLVETGALASPRTADLLEAAGRARWASALVLDDAGDGRVDEGLRRATANVQPMLAMHVDGANVYDILRFEMTVLTRPALDRLCARFAQYENLV